MKNRKFIKIASCKKKKKENNSTVTKKEILKLSNKYKKIHLTFAYYVIVSIVSFYHKIVSALRNASLILKKKLIKYVKISIKNNYKKRMFKMDLFINVLTFK